MGVNLTTIKVKLIKAVKTMLSEMNTESVEN